MMPVSIRDWGHVVLPGHPGGGICMLIAYFDHTGTHESAPVVAVAGLIANSQNWYVFEEDWAAKLAEPIPGKPPLERFHMTDCMAGEGEFSTYSRAERDLVIHDFREIILRSNSHGYCSAVSVPAWQKHMSQHFPSTSIRGEHLFVVGHCIQAMLNLANITAFENVISLVVDRRDELNNTTELVFLEQSKQTVPNLTILGPSFMPSKEVMPLQAADLYAWEVRKWAESGVATRPHAKPFERYGFEVRFFGERALAKMAAGMNGSGE
jgi:hypothetical protein